MVELMRAALNNKCKFILCVINILIFSYMFIYGIKARSYVVIVIAVIIALCICVLLRNNGKEEIKKKNKIKRAIKAALIEVCMLIVMFIMALIMVVDYSNQHIKSYIKEIESYDTKVIIVYDLQECGLKYSIDNAKLKFRTYRTLERLIDTQKKMPYGLISEINEKNIYKNNLTYYIHNGHGEVPEPIALEWSGYATPNNHVYLNIYYTMNMKSIIPHELFHIMECIIQRNDDPDIVEEFSDWNRYNPKNFEYVTNGWVLDINSKLNDDYIYKNGRSIDKVYFVSKYSTGTPHEDRAEIFSAFFSNNKRYYKGMESHYVRAKAERIFMVLRDNFASIKGDNLIWENNMDLDK